MGTVIWKGVSKGRWQLWEAGVSLEALEIESHGESKFLRYYWTMQRTQRTRSFLSPLYAFVWPWSSTHTPHPPPNLEINSSSSSVAQSCPTLCNRVECSTPGLPGHHQLPELAETHVHRVGDAIQTSHPLSSPSPPAFNLAQCKGLFQWVSSSNQVAKVLELQLQHQSFQWIFRTDFL